jgi:hypothetical protein
LNRTMQGSEDCWPGRKHGIGNIDLLLIKMCTFRLLVDWVRYCRVGRSHRHECLNMYSLRGLKNFDCIKLLRSGEALKNTSA